MIDIGRFFAERRYSTVVVLIALFTAFLVLYISWPWVNVIFLALWAAYILWFPARWLERRIHRRVLSSFIIMLVIIVLYVVMMFQVVFILANELTSFSLATTTANTTLGNAFAHFLGAGGVPVVTNVTADAGQAGSIILTAFVNAALGAIQGIIKSTPLYIFQLFIITLLAWYLLVVGDHVVAEFKSLAPRDHQATVNAFLAHLNSIYHALYVNYIFAAVISGIIALFFLPNNRRAVCVYRRLPHAHCRDHSDYREGAHLRPCLAVFVSDWGPDKSTLGPHRKHHHIPNHRRYLHYTVLRGRRGRAGIPKPVALLAYVIPFAALGRDRRCHRAGRVWVCPRTYRTYQDKRKEEDALQPVLRRLRQALLDRTLDWRSGFRFTSRASPSEVCFAH